MARKCRYDWSITRNSPGWARWLAVGRDSPAAQIFSVAVRHFSFVSLRSQYRILSKISVRHGKIKQRFRSKPLSRRWQLSLARSVIGKKQKSDDEVSADAPVVAAVPGPSADPIQLHVRINNEHLHQDIVRNIFWQLMSCQLMITWAEYYPYISIQRCHNARARLIY